MIRLHVCMVIAVTCIASSISCSESHRDVAKIVVPEDAQLEGTVYRLLDIPRKNELRIILYTASGRMVELRAQLPNPNSTLPPSELTLQRTLVDLRRGDRVRATGRRLLVINGTVCVAGVKQLSVVARAERSYAPFAF